MSSTILGIFASGGAAAAATPSYESISNATVTGTPTYVEFTSIPGTFQHLQIRIISRENTAAGGAVYIRPNNDSGANYTRHQLYSDTSAAYSNGATAETGWQYMNQPYSGTTANTFAHGIFDIFDYANTSKYKTMRGFGGYDLNTVGLGDCKLFSGLWLSTSAITSVRIAFGNAAYNFSTNSTFCLYGVKEKA